MPRLFALADLHLSLVGTKPMDVFGEAWREHPRRMAEAWDASVSPEDWVLLPGDLSWARTLAEAAPDLAWIGARPGRKLLLRGNHDSWWTSLRQVRSALDGSCAVLQNDAHDLGGVVVVGARGWLLPDDPESKENDREIFRRELERLRLSIGDADRRFHATLPRVAMLHYPPWIDGRPPSEVVAHLKRGGVLHCAYGHLHGEDHDLAVNGDREGIRFHLVAADAVGFAPRQLASW